MNLAVATMNMTEFRQHIIDAGKNSVVCMVKCAAQSMPGRLVCATADWILKLVEKSAEFSLPQEETITTEENGKSALCSKPTIRPTNWPIFLMTLATLRVFRLVWDMSAILIGCEPLHPGRIVRAMQSARRGLAALLTEEETNTRGERGERDPRGDANFNTNKRSLIQSIHLKFASLSCFDSSRSSPSPPATRMRVSANHEMAFLPAPVPDEKSTADLNSTPQRAHDSMEEVQDDESPSRETDLDESAETPTRALIDRYSAEDSEDDPSFDPDKCPAESSSEDEEQEGESLSPEELQALKEELTQTKELLKLMKAQSHMFLEDQRNSGTSPSKPIDIRPCNDSEEQRGYHSSSEYKCSDDADADFYSPVSSKSSSPERDIPPETVTNDEHEQKPKKSNGHGVTEPAQLSTSPKATNKVLYHKTKRMNHGNRKKK